MKPYTCHFSRGSDYRREIVYANDIYHAIAVFKIKHSKYIDDGFLLNLCVPSEEELKIEDFGR